MKKPNKIEMAFGLLFLCIGIAMAAELPKSEPKPPAPTIESLTAENTALKDENAKLKAANAQLQAALNRAIEQRNDAQNAEINRAAQGAKP